MDIAWFFLPMIIFLGIITSYEDIKQGKIRNRWIFWALIYGLIAYNLLILLSFFGRVNLSERFLIESATDLFFSLIFGFGSWYAGIWTAGDGKLFIAFSFLLPVSVYGLGYQQWFPSLALLINIFIPALIFMSVIILSKARWKDLKKVVNEFFSEFFEPKKIFSSAVSLFAVFWVVDLILSFADAGGGFISRMLLTVGIMSGLRKMIKEKFVYIMIAVSLLRFVIDKSVFTLDFLWQFLILIFVWRMFRSFLRGGLAKLGQKVFSEDVFVDNLKKGMVLGESIEKRKNMSKEEIRDLKKKPGFKVRKKKNTHYIKRPKSGVEINNFLGEEAEGLTLDQIKKLQKLGFRKVKVSQTMPFAPFIFAGAIFTLLANGNILILVHNLLF